MLKIIVSKNQRYSCLMCGLCCRRFNVRIEPFEARRIAELDWGDTPHPTDFYDIIHGHYYFKRTPDGGCVFLNERGVCSIHEKFGFEAKALTCRGYPMNIISVTPDTLSVLARMDCPAVLRNHGKPLVEQKRDILGLVNEMTFGQGFDQQARSNLNLETIDFICRELHKVIRDQQLRLPNRLLWILELMRQCQKLGPAFLNDLPTLKTVWTSLLRKTAQTANQDKQQNKTGRWQNLIFRAWLALYARRDEEIVARGFQARMKNFWYNLNFILGTTTWNKMGKEYPNISSRQAGLFEKKDIMAFDDETWQPFIQFLINRIDTMQFFGAAFYDQDFFTGVKALVITFTLVSATAKVNAAAQQRQKINQQDIFNAVMAIDHGHGRSPALNSLMARFYEAYIEERFMSYSMSF